MTTQARTPTRTLATPYLKSRVRARVRALVRAPAAAQGVDKLAAVLAHVQAFIEGYIAENVTAPSLREIQLGCGISSTSETRRFWKMLVDAGEIVRTRGHARAFTTSWAREAIRAAYERRVTEELP